MHNLMGRNARFNNSLPIKVRRKYRVSSPVIKVITQRIFVHQKYHISYKTKRIQRAFIFNLRPNCFQITMLLTFEIVGRARNQGKKFLKLCQTSFSYRKANLGLQRIVENVPK